MLAIAAVLARAPASAVFAAQTGATPDVEPRVLNLGYSPLGDRGTLRITVGDPDGQVLGIRLSGAIEAIADGTGPRRLAGWGRSALRGVYPMRSARASARRPRRS